MLLQITQAASNDSHGASFNLSNFSSVFLFIVFLTCFGDNFAIITLHRDEELIMCNLFFFG